MIITVDKDIRLRKYNGHYDFALPWYQDSELVWLVDGVKEPYDMDKLTAMYEYLDKHAELFFIELLIDGDYKPIGDVALSQQNLPIVIGEKAQRGRKIATRVIKTLINRARQLGYTELNIAEIYNWNIASQKCFEKLGFKPYKKTDNGSSYKLIF